MKIVALSVPFPGAKRPLEEGAKMGLWEFILLEGKVNIPPADLYLFGAWHPLYEQILPHPGAKAILWTSSIGEMDFTPVEQKYLSRLLDDTRISFIWFGSTPLGIVHERKGFYAPYPYYLEPEPLPAISQKSDIITLFCPSGIKKNILNQLYALQMAAKGMAPIAEPIPFTLHTNIVGYDDALKAIPNVVRHGWLPEAEYQALIGSARINMAMGWSETFCYQAVEAALLGTPSVSSPGIPFIVSPSEPLERLCDNAIRIAERIESMWVQGSRANSPFWERTRGPARLWLKGSNREFRKTWTEQLARFGFKEHDGQKA